MPSRHVVGRRPTLLLLAALALAACGSARDEATTTTTVTPTTVTSTTAPPAAAALPAPIPCYSGPPRTEGVGACRGGVQTFADGPCLGEVVPTPESCNGEDDDCNGVVDDGLGTITCGVGACETRAPACVAGKPGTCTPRPPRPEVCDGVDNDCDGVVDEDCPCVHVAPSGDDAAPGTAERPLRSIAAGIRRATEAKQPRRVCVAAGATCPASFDYPEAVAMHDGVSVFGGFEATRWQRTGCTTRIVARDARGVFFDDSVVAPTILDGFTVVGADEPDNAAVTITGSTGAVLSNDSIQGGAGKTSRGVRILAGARPATPHITRSNVSGGRGSDDAIGIYAFRSAPVVQGNCAVYDAAGRCAGSGCQSWAGFIRGHDPGPPGQESNGIRLEDCRGAIVAENAICVGGAAGQVAGVRIYGDATGAVVRGNHVIAADAKVAVGVLLNGCAGAAPWLFDNTYIGARSHAPSGRASGVFVSGDCHPRINANLSILGNEYGDVESDGVCCAMDAGKVSRCTIDGNGSIIGSHAGVPPTSAGVRCRYGACARIAHNARIAGESGVSTAGIVLGASAALVDANVIEGGCAGSATIGMDLVDSAARVQNNVVLGATCMPPIHPAGRLIGMRILTSPGPAEPDVHSNTVMAGGANSPCISDALLFDFTTPGSGSTRRGVFRNDVLDGGTCQHAQAVEEARPGAGPRRLLHDDLWRATETAPLYVAEGGRELRTIGEVESLPGLEARGNVSAPPPQPHDAATPCRNAGTAEGAPTRDFLGHPRPSDGGYDIGAQELAPGQ